MRPEESDFGGCKTKPAVGKQRVLQKEMAMKLDFISLISNDIIAHGFSLDIPERWILVGLVLVVIRVTRR